MSDLMLPLDDLAYRTWLATNPTGFVLNGDKARRKAHYPMLHRASCALVSSGRRSNFVDAGYYKVCAPATNELVAWTRENFRRVPTHCGVCHP